MTPPTLSQILSRRRRRALANQALCVQGASHGPAVPGILICAECQRKQRLKNAKWNPIMKPYRGLRKRRTVKES